MKNKKVLYIILSIAALVAAMSFKPDSRPRLIINFENVVDGKPLVFDTVIYKNALGQPFIITKFKYYISNISLKNENGKVVSFSDAYLINEEEPESKKIVLDDITTGSYTAITFTIGVDSVHNCNGAQTGALDPINAMYWAWNTGYIFVKMEGKSPVSKSPGTLLEFHIGGYKAPYNCIRTVTLKIKKGLIIGYNGSGLLTIQANVAELFKTPTSIDFSKLSSVTDFHNSTTIANNYCDMFSIK